MDALEKLQEKNNLLGIGEMDPIELIILTSDAIDVDLVDDETRMKAAAELARLQAVEKAAREVVNARNMTAAVIATQALAAALAALEQETK